LNAVCPDGYEYYFVDEEFVVDGEFGLAPELPVHLVERESKLFKFRRNVCVCVCVSGKAAVEMR
jgi:hypothetical protein